MKVALASYDIIWESPAENRNYLDQLLASGSDEVDLYILPEMFNSGFSMHPERFAESMNGETIAWMKEKAKELKAAICGSLAIKTSDGFANRMVFVYPDGVVKHYDKRHLFTYSGEDKHYVPGNQRVIVSYQGWKILLQVCYDLRFPVFSRNSMEYDMVIYIANWPSTRADHWRSLIKARAIENQCFSIGVNRVGSDDNGLDYSGDSLVYQYDGKCLVDSATRDGLFTSELHLDGLRSYRKSFPFLEDGDMFSLHS